MFLLLAACSTTAPSSVAPPVCAPPLERVWVVQLYFGRSIPGGGEVTEREWRRYLAEEVSPRFPDGLTAVDAQGQWRSGGVVQHEDSKVLLLLSLLQGTDQVPALSVEDREERIAALVEAYRRRFRQGSVLRIDTSGCYRFYGRTR
jgi:Protein of unknown function (DUF3574)